MNQEKKRVALIITTYSQGELLIKFLDSIIKKTKYPNYKIYFIDDSSNGEIGKRIKKRFPTIDVQINKENLGCSKSYNLGMKRAIKQYNPGYILLLNDDMEIIKEGWLEKMTEVGELNKNAGILGCRVLYPDKSAQWIAEKGRIKSYMKKGIFVKSIEMRKNQEVSEIIGCCFLIKKEVIDRIGFWDEKFSPAYGEESDYCFRARMAGFRLIYVGETEIVHHGSSSTNKLDPDWIWFLKKRNAIRLEWLNHPPISILKFTMIHFLSAISNKQPLNKLNLLGKAYSKNIKDLNEIRQKRKERTSWKDKKKQI